MKNVYKLSKYLQSHFNCHNKCHKPAKWEVEGKLLCEECKNLSLDKDVYRNEKQSWVSKLWKSRKK
jgi:hypothetical protein